MSTGTTPEPIHSDPHSYGLVLLTLCLGFFMTVLDVTIVNVAVPEMINSLSISFSQTLWVLNAYTLTFTALLLFSGRLGDLLDPRRLLIGGLTIFTLASAACGAAHTPWQLITARSVQGLGAACLMPQTLSLLTTLTPLDRRGRAFGTWGAIAGVALVAGPTIGGLLVTWLDWRWIFLVNLPVGGATILLALRCLPPGRKRRRSRPDLLGVGLSSAALFCLTFGIIEGQHYHWGPISGPISIPVLLAAGGTLWAVFLWAEQRAAAADPLLPRELRRQRTFTIMNLVTALMMFALAALLLMMTLYLQSVRGMSALAAGLTISPTPLVAVLLSPLVGQATGRGRNTQLTLILGLLVVTGGLLWLRSITHTNTDATALLPALLVMGAGMSLVLAPMNALTMHGIPTHLAGAASGLVSTSRQLGTTIGVAAVGALLENRLAHAIPSAVHEHSRDVPAQLRPALDQAFSDPGDLADRLGLVSAGSQQQPGPDPTTAAQLHEVYRATFSDAFIDALHSTLLLPSALLLLAAVITLTVRPPHSA
ncbi:MFS transporter [Streptomyces sp. XH2]|uniref:MFS transporter n=1 Tax=Streptomyces sp. XH2 TaxID=3412483 RepID=UPI003C7E5C3A